MIVVKNLRLSYPSLWKPSGMPGTEPKYNATFLMDKDSEAAKQIEAEIQRVAEEAFGKAYPSILKKQNAGDRALLKDGDTKLTKEGEPADGYVDNYYLKAANKTKPKIVNRDRTELSEVDGKPYGGCYVNAQLDFWPQDNKFGKFVNVKLLAVQFWEDGPSFGGGSTADIDAFDAAEDGDDEW